MIYSDLVIDSSGSACINMLDRYFDTFGAPKHFFLEMDGPSLVMKHSCL